jgi:hypothetical protein
MALFTGAIASGCVVTRGFHWRVHHDDVSRGVLPSDVSDDAQIADGPQVVLADAEDGSHGY